VLVGKAQVQQELKFELVVPVRSAEQPTGLHELQLSPRSFRIDVEYAQ